jgi:hypothetical protein
MKYIFAALVAFVVFQSCQDSEEKVDKNKDPLVRSAQSVDSSGIKQTSNQAALNYAPLDPNLAASMVKHFMDRGIGHTRKHEIQLIQIDRGIFEQLMTDQNPDRIRLYTGAYLANDAVADRRNKRTIILQLKKGAVNTYYDFYELFKGRLPEGLPICPPPTGTCDFPGLHNTIDEVLQALN